MDGNLIIAIAMLVGLILALATFIVFPPRRRKRVSAPPPAGQEPAAVAESMDSVMRALALVQRRYAALVRLYDETQTELRETEAERDHWKRQALGGGKR